MATKNINTSTQYFTDRNDAELCNYLRTIKSSKPLTKEEEMELGRIIQMGGKAGQRALDKLVTANLRFVVSVAKQYNYNSDIRIVDLIQEGNMGLIRAAHLYDPSKGVKFISFAVHYIYQAICEAIPRFGASTRLPAKVYNALRKFHREQERALQNGEEILTLEEFCMQHDYDLALMSNYINADNSVIRTDATLRSDEDTVTTYGDMLRSDMDVDDDMHVDSLKYELRRAMEILSSEERTVLCLKYGIDCERMLSNADIAEAIGKKRERTRQIIRTAQEKLALSPYAASLRYYLAA